MTSAHDELSIDSATHEKKKKKRPASGKTRAPSPAEINPHNKMTTVSSKPGGLTMRSDFTTSTTAAAPQAAKAHFRIDWRQLTYYHKERPSYLSNLFVKSNKQEQQHKLTELEEEEEEAEEEEEEEEEGQHEGTSRELRAPTRKPILNSLDGCFKSGELSAILGPSGAGKSTFLSALFGHKQEASYGQTRVTWFPPPPSGDAAAAAATSSSASHRRPIRIAFLPQQDHLLNHLSVYETLMFASKIKNPHQASDKLFHRQNVKRVAKMLKLTDCFNTRCGRLSGGQYKRVSIGQELLSEPDVIILDEPTSGLDAMTCLTTVRTLKSIVVRHPISIILTIHQPDLDVFNLFDQVYVIAQGGMAIYEGPPGGVAPTLARANLYMPSDSYNPARFIVENAFVGDLELSAAAGSCATSPAAPTGGAAVAAANSSSAGSINGLRDERDDGKSSSDDDEEDDEEEQREKMHDQKASFLRRSLSSLTEALGGSKVALDPDHLSSATGKTAPNLRDSGRRPLLNLGVRTAEGALVTSDQLLASARQARAASQEAQLRKQQAERLQLLRRLNRMQKAKYYTKSATGDSILSSQEQTRLNSDHGRPASSSTASDARSSSSGSSSAAADSCWSEARETIDDESASVASDGETGSCSCESDSQKDDDHDQATGHFIVNLEVPRDCGSSPPNSRATTLKHSECLSSSIQMELPRDDDSGRNRKLRRHFDKRLSAKHIQSRQADQPIWYHSFLLTHRTWLSIVRDPIFFGIQFTMHTTIPILLALIFGSAQEEGCPQVGNFDLVQFAYSSQANFIAATMRSIRQSIGNIGIIFFEMFVLSFAINCITALVFPLDMYVLLKEHRNGWYSLRSYFFGRTLADLPVPIVLHSMAMCILCYLTGQPLTWWRFAAILAIVILASLVAQSVGLTIGALLMRSSQSAVLAAAGIVAPFFALSGFIVRIHTLPWLAKWAAQASYLYHLLNGFIIMRYGFGRCPCDDLDFEQDPAHQIPGQLKTMASMWVGTYSDEFEAATTTGSGLKLNRTNVDPNIDIIDKLMGAFKMANSFGHKVDSCDDVLPYAMLDFNLKERDIWHACGALVLMLVISRAITFGAIYYKVRSFS